MVIFYCYVSSPEGIVQYVSGCVTFFALHAGVFSITSTLSTMRGDSGNFGNPWQKASNRTCSTWWHGVNISVLGCVSLFFNVVHGISWHFMAFHSCRFTCWARLVAYIVSITGAGCHGCANLAGPIFHSQLRGGCSAAKHRQLQRSTADVAAEYWFVQVSSGNVASTWSAKLHRCASYSRNHVEMDVSSQFFDLHAVEFNHSRHGLLQHTDQCWWPLAVGPGNAGGNARAGPHEPECCHANVRPIWHIRGKEPPQQISKWICIICTICIICIIVLHLCIHSLGYGQAHRSGPSASVQDVQVFGTGRFWRTTPVPTRYCKLLDPTLSN